MNEQKMDLAALGYKEEMKRTLTLRDLVLFGLVFLGPIGALMWFGITTEISGGLPTLSCLLAFCAILATTFSYAKLSKEYPLAGSAYSYTQRAINPKAGFLFGWAILLDYCFIPMLVYSAQARYTSTFLQINFLTFLVVLIIYVAIVTFINYSGIKVIATVDLIFTIMMFVAVLALVVATIYYVGINGSETTYLHALYDPAKFNMAAVTQGAVFVILVYVGFDAITTMSEEALPGKHGENLAGKAIVISVSIFTVVIGCVYYFGTLAWADYTTFKDISTAMIELSLKVGGPWIQGIIIWTIIITGFGILITAQASASRLLFGIGRDGIIPKKFFGHIDPKKKTPINNIFFMAAIGGLGAYFIPLSALAEMVSFGALLAFTGVNIACLNKFFIKAEKKTIINFIIPTIAALICLYILFGMSPLAKTIGGIWMAVGVVYLIVRSLASKDFSKLLEKDLFKED